MTPWLGWTWTWTWTMTLALAVAPTDAVRIPIGEGGVLDVAEVVVRLSERAGLDVARPEGPLTLPVEGLAGSLTRSLLADSLGDDVGLTFRPGEVVAEIAPEALAPARLPKLRARLVDLAEKAGQAAKRREAFGMHALPSYRPNDPARPTVCLVHGLNSSSTVFRHWIKPLEDAGFGVVVYDFPFNRDLHRTAPAFGRDWSEFRRKAGEARPWAVVAHSMGSLLARRYVEGAEGYGEDVSHLILLAPVNQGSGLAKGQALLQLVQGMQAVRDRKATAMVHLADGLGEAADDLLPESDFLKEINARPRRAGVGYHILAGDHGFLTPGSRRRIELQVSSARVAGGLFGGLARLAGGDLSERLDALTDGLGDGCVSVAATRLDGVDDHRTLHVNHLELIRAPLLFPEPGPVAGLPFVLECLRASPAPAAP